MYGSLPQMMCNFNIMISTVVEEGDTVDTAGTGATTSSIGANVVQGWRINTCVEGGGFGTSPELIVAGVIS
ncbi:hypothetical protein Tco_0337170 [Tanacetum coccineum]